MDFLIDIFQLIKNHSNFENSLIDMDESNQIKPIESELPLTFEQIYLRHGFIYYEYQLDFYPSDPILLNVTELHDRSLVFVNEYYRSTLTRMDMIHKTPLNSLKIGDRIGLLVENQGHACCTSKPELKVSVFYFECFSILTHNHDNHSMSGLPYLVTLIKSKRKKN